MILKKVVPVLAIVLMVTTSVQAMVVPGRWEKVAAEKPGSNIIVSMVYGDVMHCSFISLSDDSIIVSTLDGVKREYSKADVARITTADKRQDSLVNGALIGAASVGIPAGILIAGAVDAPSEKVAVPIAIFTGIGAGIGLLVDAGIKDYVTLYEAPPNVPKS